ncbi:MAG: efflux RND transporter periplasmic adaptor subunit [Bacteroidales bacterium]|nr:efflux RND transporter periplasmic adaptor subunit [Bacteroidales bacterium]
MKKSILLMLCVFLLLTGCKEKKTSRILQPVPVEVMVIGEEGEAGAQNYVGTIEAASASVLSFPVAGNITKVYVREGQKVAEGSLLAEVNDASFKQAYSAAQATLRQAQDGYDRLKLLHDKGSISEVQWVEMETKLAQAVSSEAIAKRNLENCKLRAPYSGVVGKVSAEEGMNVLPGNTVLTLLQTHGMQVNIPIPENVISSVTVGQPVRISVSALNNRIYEGKVGSKGVIANALSHNYEVLVPLKNSDGALMPGMVCNAWLPSSDTTQLIVVPNRVVKIDHTGEHYVWLASGGKAVRRTVITGGLAQRGIIIAEGLNPGDSVIVNGEQKVSTGSSVSVR